MNWIFIFFATLNFAQEAYEKGEEAKQVNERQEAFNQALKAYKEIPYPARSSGKLDYNIGNTYFQLGEYPYAILHYERAQKLRPRDENITFNLALARERAGLPMKKAPTAFQKIFFFHHSFSKPARMQIFLLLTAAAFTLFSLAIWFPNRWMQKCAVWICAVALLFLFSLGYTQYVEPLEGVIVQTTPLYRDDSPSYAKVTLEPVKAGSLAKILQVVQNGKWLKIETEEGFIGFIPRKVIRLI